MSEHRPDARPVSGRGRRVAVVVGRYNAPITTALRDGAIETLVEAGVGVGDIGVFEVAGAFELPLIAQKALSSGRFDAVIALGAVIRGDTPHFDYVCEAAMQGCLRVSLDAGKPVAFGVLTCDDLAQAKARSAPGPDNKGREAALAVLESLQALDQLSG